MMKGLGTGVRILGIGAVMATAFARPLDAQQIHRWQAFFGCWTSTDPGVANSVLCFTPDGAGVEVSTVVDGEPASTESVLADGQERMVEIEGCTGFRSVEFSLDGRRVFTRSRVACADETRSNSGVMAFVAPDRWVDVRSIEIGGEPVTWMQEYRPVDPEWFYEHGIQDPSVLDRQTVLAMRLRASQPIGNVDVEEAASHIATGAVEMWVAVQPSAFTLDASEIVRLADSGMPTSLIDLMVAVSYPDRFAVSLDGAATIYEPEPEPSVVQYSIPRRRPSRSYFFDPYFISGPYRYGRYGYPVNRYYISYWGGFPVYSVYAPRTIVIQPREPSSQGRMVNGFGYSRNTSEPRTARPVDGGSSGSRRGTSVSTSPPGRNSSPTVNSAPASGVPSRTARPRSPASAPTPTVRPSSPPRASAPAGGVPSRTARPSSPARASAPAARPSSPPRTSAPAARPSPPPRTSAPAARPSPPPRASAPAARPSSPESSSPEVRSPSSGSSSPRVDSSGGTPTGRTARPRN